MTEDVRRRIWDEMVGADARHRYFQRLSSRHKIIDYVLRFLLVLTSSGTLGSALGLLPGGPTALAVTTAVLAAINATKQFGCSALELAQFSNQWGRLHRDYVDLWDDWENGELMRDEGRSRLRGLQDKDALMSERTATIRVRRRLLTDCLSQAEAIALKKE